MEVVSDSIFQLQEFTDCTKSLALQQRSGNKHLRCQPPLQGVVKINFDGVVFMSQKELGLGMIVRNSVGKCLAWRKRIYRFPDDHTVAETIAILEVANMGLSHL
ncbi:hypothetical protein Salat_2117300 [Sesamum alatum]|uniref:RNase H type-1 domain-containing protein n=1 Tax=Sesamum alatum TaxID=300844 RepID=A0AAE2CGX9_9LAMI|nr:hypothetical protein Salat_2117300 [Sesamum alatum]